MLKKQPRRALLVTFIILPLILLTGISFRLYNSNLYEKLKLFSTILERIREDYVEKKSPEDLIEHAIKGVVSDLDPHTAYLTAEQFKKWNQSYEGYSGIGITFDIIKNKITIMSVINGGPSYKIGLLPGDRIIAINGKSAIGIKRDEVPLKLMGKKGTKVKVTIEREGWTQPKEFVITRGEVHLKSIPYAFMLKSGVGYIDIVRFSSTTGDELEKILRRLESKNLKYLIIDLRNNGGGYLDAAVKVVDKFLPGGKRIIYTKGRIPSSFREFFSTNRATHPLVPLMIIINRSSASASEIVAGSLQDWDRALILGETSFGKGLVQTQYRFKDGSALLMTTARYYTPTGRLIQRPYKNGDFENYFAEITNDSLRKKWERNPSRPSYRTQILKRKVYGGGGITPDIFLKSKNDTVSFIMRKMITSPKRLFFTFVEYHMKSHPWLKKDFNSFLQNYNPGKKTLLNFLHYIRKAGFKITNQEFIKNERDIRFLLKQTIASKIWGDEARYKVQMLRDHELLEALKYLPKAEELLRRAYHYKRGK